MKTVFVPLLVPFFNFKNEIIGAVRIYYGIVISNPYITLSCSVDESLRKFLENQEGTDFYGYCEIKDNPTLSYAINHALSTYFENTNTIKRSGNVYEELYNTDGSIVVRPKSIRIEKHLLSDDVLLLTVNPGSNNLEEIVCNNNVPQDQRTFTDLSKEYSEVMCDVVDVVKETSSFSLCFSCCKSTINYLVRRRDLAKLIEALIQLGVDADSLRVSGLFSRKHVVYVKSPHVQKTS
ncbi:MAG: hypothetical protein J7J78_02915 [Thermoprotei archaeon]|nr:hypothetical protein [Thermoprotei archaeon]